MGPQYDDHFLLANSFTSMPILNLLSVHLIHSLLVEIYITNLVQNLKLFKYKFNSFFFFFFNLVCLMYDHIAFHDQIEEFYHQQWNRAWVSLVFGDELAGRIYPPPAAIRVHACCMHRSSTASRKISAASFWSN